MICEDARLAIGAAPDESTAELEAHLAGCAQCREFRVQTLALNERIRGAMQLPPPGFNAGMAAQVGIGAPAAIVPTTARRATSRRGWALAASVLLAVVAVALLWPVQSGTALAGEVVQHLSGSAERGSWDNTAIVEQGVLDTVLRQSGVSVALEPSHPIVYAHSCVLRGRSVPHLVIQTDIGPVTVMPMPGESLAARQTFNENGLSGVLLPQPGGAIAVLARGTADVSVVAAEISQRIRLRR
jgi:hypothetical protein